ncbi:MAG: hypothetical protein ACLUR9_05970 [Christensenellales bacterium]
MAATMDTGFDALANAIIERAANDYITANENLQKSGKSKRQKTQFAKFESFSIPNGFVCCQRWMETG